VFAMASIGGKQTRGRCLRMNVSTGPVGRGKRVDRRKTTAGCIKGVRSKVAQKQQHADLRRPCTRGRALHQAASTRSGYTFRLRMRSARIPCVTDPHREEQ
jgi:hypothetical protein